MRSGNPILIDKTVFFLREFFVLSIQQKRHSRRREQRPFGILLILRAKVAPRKISNLNRISMPAVPRFPALSVALSRYRSRSFNLKTAFHAFKLHTKVASSRSLSSFHFASSSPFPLPPPPVAPRVLFLPPPVRGIFSRGSSIRLHSSHRKRGSFESLLSSLVFHGLMLPGRRLVGGIRIYLGTP